MDLFELSGQREDHYPYKNLAASNKVRQYSFLDSMITAALEIERPMLFQSIIKALNFHAVVGLHHAAGKYRLHPVVVGEYRPPEHYSVPPLMDDFVNLVNRYWQATDPLTLSAFALWSINHIHPFVNGNGRTARAVCYFILCVKSGGLLPGDTILPEMLRAEPDRTRYVQALQRADQGDENNLDDLIELIRELLHKQITQRA